MLNNWKRQLLEVASNVFESGNDAPIHNHQQAQIDKLYRQIRQLKVERDFLANRSTQLGLQPEKL